MVTDTMTERFWAKVDTSGDCWEWTAGVDTMGYGALRVPGPRTSNKKIRASRYSWMLHNGTIPSGKHVLHTCDNRRCVNPKHLWLGSHSDNMKDMAAKGRHPMHSKTHCKRGHPLEGDNVYHYGPELRWRGCRACRADAGRRYDSKNREYIG